MPCTSFFSSLPYSKLQHNAAHLGIVTGLCLSEASSRFFHKKVSGFFLFTAMLAAVSTALAEILGGAIGLNMLFGLPLNIGGGLTAALTLYMILTNSYRRIEKWIIGFVSLIGLGFLFELSFVTLQWGNAMKHWVLPSIPSGALPVVMSVLGAVVMPHNIFLHSEIIQSRQWNLKGETMISKQLRFEFMDTLTAMLIGWAINSAMILVAASVFNANGVLVTELPQAQETLRPLMGNAAAVVFAIALVLAGFASSVTCGMAGGSIFAGISGEPYDISDNHSRVGVFITIAGGLLVIFFLKDPFQGIIWSQIFLSMQLPLTVFGLIWLTSSEKVMGKFANSLTNKVILWTIAIIVSFLNLMLIVQIVRQL